MKAHDPPLVFSRSALRELDRRALEQFHVPILVLMENAGRAVADAVLAHLKARSSVLIVCGPGNNGADGLVAARHLHNAGFPVQILSLFDPHAPAGAPDSPLAIQLKMITAMKLPLRKIADDHAEIRDWIVDSQPHDIIIDALFGTGLSRDLTGPAHGVIAALNLSRRTIISIDIPSGLDCDTGQPLAIAIKATQTISFCGTKKGFANPVAKLYLGKLTIGDLGAPVELLHELASTE